MTGTASRRAVAILAALTVWMMSLADGYAQTPQRAETGSDERILVQRLEPVGVSERVAQTMEEALVFELGRREGVVVVSPAELEQTVAFAAEQAQLGCDALDECMVEVQRKLQVARLVAGKVSKLGDEYFLTLGIVDLADRAVGTRVTRQAAAVDELRSQVGEAVDEILGHVSKRPSFRLEAGESLNLAVMPLTARGVPSSTADAMTQILSAELNSIDGVSVMSRDDIEAMLDKVQVEGELGCTANMECVVEIGAALGLSKLVTGTVGKIKQAYVIGLQLIDIRSAHVVNRVLESFEGDPAELKHAIKLAAYQVAGVSYEDRRGSVDFTFSVGQADVRLGDRRVPMRGHELSLGALAPGRYSLRVVPDPDDYYPLQTDVYVSPGGTNVRTFTIDETPADWYESWWFWTAAGVVVAGVAATTIVLLNQQQPTTGSGVITVGAPGAAL